LAAPWPAGLIWFFGVLPSVLSWSSLFPRQNQRTCDPKTFLPTDGYAVCLRLAHCGPGCQLWSKSATGIVARELKHAGNMNNQAQERPDFCLVSNLGQSGADETQEIIAINLIFAKTSRPKMKSLKSLAGSVILVTGGTGSFGNRVASHLLKHKPAQIRIYSRDEKKQWEMRKAFPRFRYIVGDVRDLARLSEAMREVDYVFHAAALKQVPSCETYPFEAVKTNVLGSQNACEAAKYNGVKCLVALSTDKAVKPVNAMGISKAMLEKIVCSQNESDDRTVFCCVRYGNVMGSRGSVIPLFLDQIRKNLPLTITVPEMTRFLMTLDQSVDLVMHAMTQARGGEVFVRKAPACTVLSLAEAMRLKYSPRRSKHPIKIIGIRPGEKIHEILVNEYEMQRVTEEKAYFTIHPEYCIPKHLSSQYLGAEYTSANTQRLTGLKEIGSLLDAMGQVEMYI
jgi:FlaA1/EpsC-like NDP-sugar epimerase